MNTNERVFIINLKDTKNTINNTMMSGVYVFMMNAIS